MNQEDIDKQIAKLLGWKLRWQNVGGGALLDKKPSGHSWEVWTDPDGWGLNEDYDSIHPPNYTNDLNAIHEAIKFARENFRDIDKDPFWCDGEFMVNTNIVLKRNHYDDDVPLLLITASQYCEIYLRTLNLWK